MAGSLTRGLADFITSVDARDLPAAAVDLVQFAMLDNLGVMCGAFDEPSSRHLQRVVVELGGVPVARVLATAIRTSPPSAAFVNGAMGHALDFDDACVFGHSSVVLVPTILAIAEMRTVTGLEAILAYATGFEVGARLRQAIDIGQHRGWHPTAVCGTFAAAAAASQLLHLDAEQTTMALGIAASEASGLAANAGTMAKPYHVGAANRNGIMAALLAREGLTANPMVIESATGFARAFGGIEASGSLEKIVSGLGTSFELVDRGLSIKRYASCYATHWAVDALLDLMRTEGFSGADVQSIECLGRPKYLDVLPYHRPATGLEAKFSMEYCVAATLVSGRLRLEDFSDEQVARPEVAAFLSRVTLAAFDDWSLERDHDTRPDRLTVALRGGQTLTRDVLRLPGSLDAPETWDQGLEDKFRASVEPLFGATVASFVMSTMLDMQALVDLSGVTTALTYRS